MKFPNAITRYFYADDLAFVIRSLAFYKFFKITITNILNYTDKRTSSELDENKTKMFLFIGNVKRIIITILDTEFRN